jgi:ceramide glucosyltransferase
MTLAVGLAGAFLVLAIGAQFASILLAFRHTRQPRHALPDSPAVTILRPVCGIENAVEETLHSTFAIDWPDYEIVFCCASAADPVMPLVERLIAEHPHVPARLLTGDDRISINPKLNNLVKGWAAARHDWVLMADSNIVLPADYIRQLFSFWLPGTGLVCSPPIGGRPEGAMAELECAFLNTYQARWQLAAAAIGLGFAQGKTMLWRRDILDAAGGIRALASEPAEDAAATKVVRNAGLRVRLAPGPFVQPLGARDFAHVWARQIRWARLRRTTFKAFFIPELFTGAFFPTLAVTALALADIVPYAAIPAFAIVWYAAEAALARAAGWHLSGTAPLAWLVRDCLLPFLWIAAWVGNGFVWRGNAMQVGSDGDGILAGLNARAARLFAMDESVGVRDAVIAALARRRRGRKPRDG